MKENVCVAVEKSAIALLSGVTYKNEKVWYGEAERSLQMSMYIPKHREQCSHQMPLIVWLCGGAIQVVDKDVWMPQMIKFAEAGYIIASVEYRTSNEAPLPAPLIDVKAAIRYLRAHHEQYCIDPNRVFIMGESAGGMLASLVGTTSNISKYDIGDFLDQSSAVNAVIDFYGLVDLERAYHERKSDLVRGVECLQKVAGSSINERMQALREFSAINHVSQSTPPFMILHGTADDVVDISQSDLMYNKLESYGIPCTYFRFEGCNHGVDNFYQDQVKDWIISFLRQVQ